MSSKCHRGVVEREEGHDGNRCVVWKGGCEQEEWCGFLHFSTPAGAARGFMA